MLSGEEVVLTSANETGEQVASIFEQSRNLVHQYEETNGQRMNRKLQKEWQEVLENSSRSSNLVVDTMLVKNLSKIKDKKKDQKEISSDLVYETCLLFLKYDKSDMKLPTCLINALQSNPETIIIINDTIQDALKKLKGTALVKKD
jgi:hypothetical protein